MGTASGATRSTASSDDGTNTVGIVLGVLGGVICCAIIGASIACLVLQEEENKKNDQQTMEATTSGGDIEMAGTTTQDTTEDLETWGNPEKAAGEADLSSKRSPRDEKGEIIETGKQVFE